MDARALGLNVIVSIQDEQQSGETTPVQLSDATTTRVWAVLAPLFNGDRGIMYELLNEPEPAVSDANWASWRDAMNPLIASIRATGSQNVVIADGLIFALSLNGAPALTDPAGQVAYAIHPYFHSAADQLQKAWDTKLGDFAATAPVIATEWTTVANAAVSGSSYYCDATTAAAALDLLQYLSAKGVGLAAFAYDFSGNVFGSGWHRRRRAGRLQGYAAGQLHHLRRPLLRHAQELLRDRPQRRLRASRRLHVQTAARRLPTCRRRRPRMRLLRQRHALPELLWPPAERQWRHGFPPDLPPLIVRRSAPMRDHDSSSRSSYGSISLDTPRPRCVPSSDF
jgi:hypothetical protein